MNDSFELLDPRNAQAFLKTFESDARRKGEAHFRKSHVHDLTPEQPGMAYSALVNDGSQPAKVHLQYDPIEGWSGDCSCPLEFDCEHVFAAMRALLAEHSTAAVRSLSSGASPASAGWTKSTSKAEDESGGLDRRLRAVLGRPLKAEETKFIRKVHTLFARSRQSGHITYRDFDELDLRLGGYGWAPLEIWPALPANEHEFWLYIANAAREHQLPIPEFMAPITDLTGIQDRLVRWKRSREVERWKNTLGNLQLAPPLANREETELRLVIDEKEARLQWQRGGHDAFETIKPAQLQHIPDEERRGRLFFTAEGALLWQLLSTRFYLGSTMHLRYSDMAAANALGRVLRTPLLASRVVNREGLPLLRPAEPLRWAVTPAETEEEDYRLRLVQANGAPPPPVFCVIPGNPTLYLTANEVFTGPAPQEHILDPLVENPIPAPAIERAAGVAFLQSLGLELPPRVRERVRTLPLEVAIKCELRPLYIGSNSEECCLTVIAEAADGHQETWHSHGWTNTSVPRAAKKKDRRETAIVVYDRTLLQMVPEVLEPLDLKADSYNGNLSLRVSKKFPELFSAWLKTVPPQITVHLGGDLASFANTEVSGRVKLDVTETTIDWFDLRVVLDVSDTTLSPEEIKLLLNAKGGFVRLEGKGWRRLQFDLSEEENERLARLGLSTRELSTEPQRLHALQLADDAAKKFLPEQQVEQIQRRVSEIKARVAPDLPAGVTAQLRPYQLEGFHFLAYLSANNFGGILADDMGLGKTVQTLAWLVWLREQSKVQSPESKVQSPKSEGEVARQPSLVVCPKSVMDNWHAEAERFTPGLRVKLWPASQLSGFTEQLASADLHVLNYSQLRLLGESLMPVRWQTVILDEGQYIKNPNSQTAQIARGLRAEQRLVLSGTPIENRLLDLWSLMAFAMPGVLGSRAQFARLYDSKGDPFARRRLSARVRPFLVRRTKAQVAKDLPDRIEEDLFCEIEGEQKTLYRAELKRAQQMLLRIKTQKDFAQERFHFLTSLLRLRQVCCHPRLVKADSEAPSAKTEALLEQLEPIMEEGHKVLVFSQFVEMLGLLRPVIEARNWPVFYLAGDTENRGDLVRDFQSTEGPAIFLISLKAGGFGLNLTAASYVVLFDPWWNPAVENQAIDRTHRIGQVNKVIAYRLLIKNSIEEKIRELQKSKKAL
ncbi:MAG: hypothetical protein QOJ40_1476, partial [Verrucomicrobiota bacterium]